MPHPDHEKNRAAWNQMVDLHVNHPEYLTQQVIDGGSSLKHIELDALGDVRGKSLLHLQCQFGLDTLSWARKGAAVTGVDISDRSIEVANEIKVKAGLSEAEFVLCDVLDLVGKIDRQFDFVFQSYGTHIWLSDIRKWGKVVAHHLKPGGTFFIIDEHPANVFWLWDPEFDYFATEPERTLNPKDYCETGTRVEGEHVEWQHKVSDIVNALIEAGLVIERLDEYNYGYYKTAPDWIPMGDGYWTPPTGRTKFPVMLGVKARKPE